MDTDAGGQAVSNHLRQAMLAWFPSSQTTTLTTRKPFSEPDLRQISELLRQSGQDSWSRIPRIYATLRVINQLPAIDAFLTQGVSDVWFPFSHKTLPGAFTSQSARCDFLDAQSLVLSKALDLEKENGKHRHFSKPTDIPFQKVAELGKGGFGYVDKVFSTISYKEYARKLIPRGRTFRKDQEILKDFEKELATLKKLSHMHIVELVGSYTDPRYVGIIMSPVADCNLKEFLTLQPLSADSRSFLRTFFGCLAAALDYLHQNRIRHKDIKPQNVLVKGHQVYLTDFGISRDWSELGHSTTTGFTVKTPRYAAPEVAAYDPRNSSADIWSLGCVFLEIWSVLCGKTVSQLDSHMASTGSQSNCYYQNTAAISSWCESVFDEPASVELDRPRSWIKIMLEEKAKDRCNAQTLLDHIQEANADPDMPFTFTGLCCIEDEDTAESVQSSVFEYDITGTTDVSSTVGKPHPESAVSNDAAVVYSPVPIHMAKSIDFQEGIIEGVTHTQASAKLAGNPTAEQEKGAAVSEPSEALTVRPPRVAPPPPLPDTNVPLHDVPPLGPDFHLPLIRRLRPIMNRRQNLPKGLPQENVAPPLPPTNPVFGVDLNTLYARSNAPVPTVVVQCIQAVELFGLDVEGIYRVPGSMSRIQELRSRFDNDAAKVDFKDPVSFEYDIHSVSGVLKLFLRTLPVSLLINDSYDELIAAARVEDDTRRRDSLHAIINNLPDANYGVLRVLALHLNRVSKASATNRMTSTNLAIVFAPVILYKESSLAESGLQIRIILTILDNALAIFDEY